MTSLTVILPTYNGERFLRPQIDSILAQTIPELELLAIDDGSSDDTVAILDDYVARDRRVRRLPSVGNIGQRARLRQLVEASTTAFVAFADQDDVWHPERNALLLDAVGDRAVAFGRSQLMDAEGRDLGRSILEELKIDAGRAGPLATLFRSLVSAHASIVRKDWLDIAIFSSPIPFDWQFGVEALLSTGLVYVDEAIVQHRIHGGNQTNSGAVRSRPKLMSLYNARANTSFVRADRLYLFQFLDQLSRSTMLSADVRRVFSRATEACRHSWYQPLDFKPGKGRRLERDLHALLDHLASSTEDLAYFTKRLRSVTRAQFAPVNIANIVSRYADKAS